MRFLSIRVKLMILALIILVPLVTLQLFNIGKNVRRSTDQKLEASAEFAYAISKVFYKYIKELWIQESIIGEYISSNIDDIDEIQSYLDKIVRNDDNNIQRLSWANPDGLILASTRPYMIGLSIEDRDYYQMIKDGQEKVISDLVESYVDGALVVPVARGVKINGQLAGMVVYSISVDRLAASISDIKLNKGDILSLVDRSGRIVFLIPMWKKKKSIVIPI